MTNPMVSSLYTSADMEEDISITYNPVEGFWQSKSPFWVVFQGQSIVMSLYTLADMEMTSP